MNHKKHLAIVSVLVLLGAGLTYWILDNVYQLPVQASAEAIPIDALFQGHFILISFLFSLVVVFMLYSLIVFRRRPGDEGDGEYIHGSNALEVAWTVIPLILVVGFGIWGWTTLDEITAEAPDEMVVEVTGLKWQWQFHYPDIGELATTPNLVVPVGQPIRLEMESQDVIHSFWVPEFRVKKDLLPGQKTTLRITPTEAGTYAVRCAEICGERHAYMLAEVRVLAEGEYAVWRDELSAIASLPPADRGRLTWENNCASCHSIDGSDLVGPTWLGLFGREEQMEDGTTIIADEAYITQSIYEPNAQIVAGYPAGVMPQNYAEQLSDEDVANLIEFIKTLTEE
jgi:cytochrome c oxidase subunit 2